jgi:hypothetical protein
MTLQQLQITQAATSLPWCRISVTDSGTDDPISNPGGMPF